MKKIAVVLCLLSLIFIVSSAAYADMGPKPSVSIDFEGVENELYYVTLLSEEETTGPYSVSNDIISKDHYLIKDDQETGLKAWKAFRKYSDTDGFYFIEYFQKCNDEQNFSWDYYPPQKFKILLYFPDTEQFAVSGIYERYAFDSYFTAKVSDLNFESVTESATITAEHSYDYTWELISLAARIIITIAVEIAVALPFGLKSKKTLLFIAIINIITQTLLNVLLNLSNYYNGSFILVFNYIWMEAVIFVIEAAAYSIYLKKIGGYENKKWLAPVYSLTANAASFAAGFLLIKIIPGIF